MTHHDSPDGKTWFNTRHPISTDANRPSKEPEFSASVAETARQLFKKEQQEALSRITECKEGYVCFN